MTDEADGVLRRWSRLKREAQGAVREEAEPPAEAPPPEEPFDPASLPPVESLGAESDYTGFLKPEVPKALRRAALRRAWATDPAITGYRTLADYDWDFNAPGYGRLRPTDQPKAMAEAMFRHLRRAEQDRPAIPAAPPADPAAEQLADGASPSDAEAETSPQDKA